MTAQARARRIDKEALQRKAFVRVGYEPHKGQQRIHRSRARHRVASCGRRFGKSHAGGYELFTEALKTRLFLPRLEDSGKRREFWVVGPNYTDSEKEFRVMYNALKKVGAPFDKPGTYNDPHGGDMQVSLYGGKFIVIAKSAAKPESLVGEGLNGVIMAEAAKQKESTWTKFVRPMLSDFGGWSLHTSTPEGKNWFYESWMRGQSEDADDWESWRMPAWSNPVVYPGGAQQKAIDAAREMMRHNVPLTDAVLDSLGINREVGALMRDLTQETFNQEIGAQFTEFVGRVFKDFDEEVHVKDFAYDPALPTYAAVDYGFTNPFVWLLLQIDFEGCVYVVDEVYERGLTIDEAMAEVEARGLVPGNLRQFYPDPASPGDTRAIEKRFRIKGMRGTGGDLSTRLRMIRAALKVRHVELEPDDPLRKPRLIINRRCKETIRDFNDYRYPKSVSEAAEAKDYDSRRTTGIPENPMKRDDHAPEALGRFYAGFFSTPERADGARVTAADYAA